MNPPNFMKRRTLIALCFRFNCKTLPSRHERETLPGSDTAQAWLRRVDGAPVRKYARFMATVTEPETKTSSESRTTPVVQLPINLKNWIEENREKFKPPVSNRYLYEGRDFFVMVIKGPNARNDFHLVDSEEYFYQLKGDIKVRVREGERIVDHIVRQGDTFFIPPNVPHSPQRPPDTIGVVVERRRPPGEMEHVIFYCENCGALVEDIHFDCADIVQHFSQAMLDFWNDDARRTCKKCGKKVEQPGPMQPF
jgi:3-hydroxyanthranilate 3,4-dioxygenase